jgi:hypothetical protein
MKKLLFSLTLLLPIIASAQEEIKYGINAGPSLADIRGDGYAADFNYGIGYLFGLTMEVPLNQRFSFCTGINYERKSSIQKTSFSYNETIIGPDGTAVQLPVEGTGKITTKLDYIVVPVNLKYYLDIWETYYATGGGFIAYALNEGYTVKGDIPMTDYQQNYENLDYGVSFGIGTKFKLNRTQEVNIELRDNLGLANVTDIDSDKISTNSINLILNWQFSL